MDPAEQPTPAVAEGKRIPPTRQVLKEALSLAEEILRNIELSEASLTNIALKATRLARLLNDFDMQKTMQFEVAGYPTGPEFVPPEPWRLAIAAGRGFEYIAPITRKHEGTRIFLESIDALEVQIRSGEVALSVAHDVPEPPLAPHQVPSFLPKGNSFERANIQGNIRQAADRLASRRNFIYQYAAGKYYELKFSGIAGDVFGDIRERVDADIGKTVPDAVRQFAAVHDNLASENPEDWSNAVHSCRRILQGLADALFPPTEEEHIIQIDGKEKKVKLGAEQYINRLIAFIEESSKSTRFEEIVGSHLRFLGDRLDSIFRAAQKGSHATVSKEEADRYVIYTYLIVGDILTLKK